MTSNWFWNVLADKELEDLKNYFSKGCKGCCLFQPFIYFFIFNLFKSVVSVYLVCSNILCKEDVCHHLDLFYHPGWWYRTINCKGCFRKKALRHLSRLLNVFTFLIWALYLQHKRRQTWPGSLQDLCVRTVRGGNGEWQNAHKMIKTEKPHKASRKAHRETGKVEMVKKHEFFRDWEEETVRWHTGSMQLVKEKLTYKRRCSVRDALFSLFSCIRLHHRWITHECCCQTSLDFYPSLEDLFFAPGVPQSLSPELPLESRAEEGHGICQI